MKAKISNINKNRLMNVDFCSLSFASSFEGVLATAPVIERLLLIEYNKPWTEQPIKNNDLPNDVKKYLQQCIDDQIFSRIILIKHKKSEKGKINIYAVNNRAVSPFVNHFLIKDYDELLHMDFTKCFGELESAKLNKEFYLVCTNGKVDKCCAKFGIPLYKSLEALDENVWQCTHITGCRFAPNVISVPYLHYYGHLDLKEIPQLYQSLKGKKIYSPKYRGRTCFTNEVQAAEYFLRNEIDEFDYQSLEMLSSKHEGELFYVCFLHLESGTKYIIELSSQKSKEKYILNCKQTNNHVMVFDLIKIFKNKS
ncbi:sucrase ferredoxin [Chondrinema litorale]|uniref:sucrase ferredoxin n=1 Tax=Chondrinema litorale TaxID=2994555 RepID=UPI0025438945|nr:sucrase ferredoxin [Chondrinema litorale]UZR96581.1 hypothetical protein OQ292_20755 [Chondrinema litorale]